MFPSGKQLNNSDFFDQYRRFFDFFTFFQFAMSQRIFVSRRWNLQRRRTISCRTGNRPVPLRRANFPSAKWKWNLQTGIESPIFNISTGTRQFQVRKILIDRFQLFWFLFPFPRTRQIQSKETGANLAPCRLAFFCRALKVSLTGGTEHPSNQDKTPVQNGSRSCEAKRIFIARYSTAWRNTSLGEFKCFFFGPNFLYMFRRKALEEF